MKRLSLALEDAEAPICKKYLKFEKKTKEKNNPPAADTEKEASAADTEKEASAADTAEKPAEVPTEKPADKPVEKSADKPANRDFLQYL